MGIGSWLEAVFQEGRVARSLLPQVKTALITLGGPMRTAVNAYAGAAEAELPMAGPQIRNMLGQVRQAAVYRDVARGHWHDSFLSELESRFPDKTKWIEGVRAIESGDTTHPWAAYVSRQLEDYLAHAQARGMNVPARQRYFPHLGDWDKIEKALEADPGGTVAKFMAERQRLGRPPMTPKQVMGALGRQLADRRLPPKSGSVEFSDPFFMRERELALPEEFRLDPDTSLRLYLRRGADALARADAFGDYSGGRFADDLQNLRASGSIAAQRAADLLEQLYKSTFMVRTSSTTLDPALDALVGTTLVAHTPLITLRHLGQIFSPAVLEGFGPWAKGLSALASGETREGVQRLSRELGMGSHALASHILSGGEAPGTPQELSRVMRGTISRLFDRLGFPAMQRELRGLASATFLEKLDYMAKNPADKASQIFQEMHLPGLAPEEAQSVMQRAVEWGRKVIAGGRPEYDPVSASLLTTGQATTMFMFHPADLPAIASSRNLRAAFTLQRWAYQQSSVFVNEVLNRARRGDIMPLVRMMAVGSTAWYAFETGLNDFVMGRRLKIRDGQLHIDPESVADMRGIRRWLYSQSPYLEKALHATLQGHILGIAGSIFASLAESDNPAFMNNAFDPIILRDAGALGQALSQTVRLAMYGQFGEAWKPLTKQALKWAGPVAVAPTLAALPVGGPIAALGATAAAQAPRFLGAQLETGTRAYAQSRREALEAYFERRYSDFDRLNDDLMTHYGRRITQADIEREAVRRIRAMRGLRASQARPGEPGYRTPEEMDTRRRIQEEAKTLLEGE